MASTDIFEHFDELEDPRMDRQKRHCLMDIVFISVCAVVCSATSFVDMYDFGCAKREWLEEHLELANGIPSHDTFRRVFSLINPDVFRSCFMSWTQALCDATGGDIVAFDGKTLRRSFDTATSGQRDPRYECVVLFQRPLRWAVESGRQVWTSPEIMDTPSIICKG